MTDNFKSNAKGLESPADEHFAITPNDSTDLAITPRVIYIGTGGTLVLRDKNDIDIEYNPGDNSYIIFRAVRVLSTGTTATGIVGNL